MHATLLLAALLGPVSPLQRSCPAPSGFAAHLPQQMLRPLGAAYDPETLRVAYGIAAQLTVCPPNQVSTGTPCAVHRVYRPAAGEIVREPLVLFLPGSGMEPERHDFVLQAAAYAGFRTIGLSYDNTGTIESQCNGADCLDCFGQVRDEIITGDNRRLGGQTVVRRSDSIVERLNNLLRALYADDLADGVDDDHWRDFYFPVVIGPKHAIGSIR